MNSNVVTILLVIFLILAILWLVNVNVTVN
jgi:hypothetical protein